MKRMCILILMLLFLAHPAYCQNPVTLSDVNIEPSGGQTDDLKVDVDDISAGTQTSDVKVTMDGEEVEVTMNGEEVEVTMNSETVNTEYLNTGIAVGEVAGATDATQCPTVTANMVMFKAVKGNAGNVYIGVSGVTVVDGSTDTTSGWELGAGESTPWIPASNLNLFYYICDNAGDDFVYMVLQ